MENMKLKNDLVIISDNQNGSYLIQAPNGDTAIVDSNELRVLVSENSDTSFLVKSGSGDMIIFE